MGRDSDKFACHESHYNTTMYGDGLFKFRPVHHKPSLSYQSKIRDFYNFQEPINSDVSSINGTAYDCGKLGVWDLRFYYRCNSEWR